MKSTSTCQTLFVCMLCTALVCFARVSSAVGQQSPEPLSSQPLPAQRLDVPADAAPDQTGWGTAAGLRYLEIIRGGASPNEKLQLLIVIHGLGDKPHHDWLSAIDVDAKIKVRMILPQAPTPYGNGYAWFPYRAGNLDQAALAGSISAAAERLTKMLGVLQTQRPTRGRAVVTGFSQGGMLSYALAVSHPELLELAVPISGMLPVPLWPVSAPAAKWFPTIRSLHGKADELVRFEVDEKLIERMRGLGYPVELVAFDATPHTISPQMSALVKATLTAAFASTTKKSPTAGKPKPAAN